MVVTYEVINAIAGSINIADHDEAARLARAVTPHYRAGRLTWRALITACHFLYHGFDNYQTLTKAHLPGEARAILRLGETAATHPPTVRSRLNIPTAAGWARPSTGSAVTACSPSGIP